VASVAIAGGIALGGCDSDKIPFAERHLKPLSEKMLADIERLNMSKDSPILVRVFKQESEFEVWKQDRTGTFAKLKTYPICRWSGELGPKIKEGDRQAPEGFYTVTPGQMNPKSQFYLAFNIGYPNAYDRAHGRTGGALMVHGDCSSRGCYSMTDEQISEIYALGRESFFGGQRSFQVQAYPFRMTALNMAKHRNNPNMPFWKMLKVGYDHFEVSRQQPKVDVCEKRYVFNAYARGDHSRPLTFHAEARCPAFEVPSEIASAMLAKQRKDAIETAELIRRGTPAAPIRTNTDGGMHPVFRNALRGPTLRDGDGNIRPMTFVAAPGTIPSHVNPPREPNPEFAAEGATGEVPTAAQIGVLASVPLPRPAPLPREDAPPEQPSLASRFEAAFGVASAQARPAAPPQRPAAPQPVVLGAPPPGGAAATRDTGPRGSEVRSVEARKPAPAARPTATASAAPTQPALPRQTAEATAPVGTAAKPAAIPGSHPVLPAGTFESRWSAFR
jgi:murein L,D-transpeptidase YafK